MTELDVGVWSWVSVKYAPGVGLLTTLLINYSPVHENIVIL